MESEGPYHIRKGPFDTYERIEGPTVVYSRLGEIQHAVYAMNSAFAEGRKAAEKDFRELLEIADGMRSWCDVKEGWAMIWGMQFDAWKKARGIE